MIDYIVYRLRRVSDLSFTVGLFRFVYDQCDRIPDKVRTVWSVMTPLLRIYELDGVKTPGDLARVEIRARTKEEWESLDDSERNKVCYDIEAAIDVIHALIVFMREGKQ